MSTETYSGTTEAVECPYCGHINRVTDLHSDLNGPEAAETECGDCERTYRAVFHVSISVRAMRIDG